MSQDLIVLTFTAAFLGFFHTLFGPDHYVPFIMMSKARNWSLRKTMFITGISGIGHVTSSIVIGTIGIAAGIALTSLVGVESIRGEIAAWGLITFGLVYFAWGMKRAFRKTEHVHKHVHKDGRSHVHRHRHTRGHLHAHTKTKGNIVPWALFTIFLFGPCEPLIPILMFPAMQNSIFGVVLVSLVFGIATIATMLTMVYVSTVGLARVKVPGADRFIHAMSGGTIAAAGLAIVLLGV